MAIRLRQINGMTVALCAAETDPHPGDVYLDDAQHHALSTKFGLDWEVMGFIDNPPVDTVLVGLMDKARLRDAESEFVSWDKSGRPGDEPNMSELESWIEASRPKPELTVFQKMYEIDWQRYWRLYGV